ncbi:hypothetical protein ILYODFUR_012369 [Ilyodon furcidens]|uniref:Uncharacterized protein n=1 Tax=Ilyodon furcidens TaxID=33524 RepID=A0ABV0URQ1_9TELE
MLRSHFTSTPFTVCVPCGLWQTENLMTQFQQWLSSSKRGRFVECTTNSCPVNRLFPMLYSSSRVTMDGLLAVFAIYAVLAQSASLDGLDGNFLVRCSCARLFFIFR